MPLLLEHVEDKLALHGILDKLIFADVAVSLFIHSISVNCTICKNHIFDKSCQPYVRNANSNEVFVLLNTSQPTMCHQG